MADSGDALVLWSQNAGGSSYQGWAMDYTVADGWGSAVRLGTGYTGGETLAMTPAGEAVVVWTERGGETYDYDLVARRHVVGSGWSEPTQLYSDPEIPALYATVAIDGSRDASVIWTHREPAKVVARHFDAATESGASPTEAAAAAEPEAIVTASSDVGPVFVAWEERRTSTGDRSIVAAHETPHGLVASDLEDYDSSESYSLALSACPDGRAIVLWSEESGLYTAEYR